ncbi:MAG: hypothetical protein AB7O97_10990 [Planctomycetota bacterium]
MGTAPSFWISFGTTLALLATALVSGLRGGRRLHLVAGPLTLVSLAVTVVLTEQLMRGYRFPEQALRVHLWFAKAGGALALPVLLTGIWLWRRPAARRWHLAAVLAFVVGALLATGTGVWMFVQGEPK